MFNYQKKIDYHKAKARELASIEADLTASLTDKGSGFFTSSGPDFWVHLELRGVRHEQRYHLEQVEKLQCHRVATLVGTGVITAILLVSFGFDIAGRVINSFG